MNENMIESGLTLMDLQGEGALLQTIFEFLTVAELGQAELLCRSIRQNDIPFVWVKIVERSSSLPINEARGGPSVTLPAKDRMRRWSVATACIDGMEQAGGQDDDEFGNEIIRFAAAEYITTIDSTRLQCNDYFVRLSRLWSQDGYTRECILGQGFVPPILYETKGLLNLSIDPLRLSERADVQGLLEHLRSSETTDSRIVTAENNAKMCNLSTDLFARCQLTVVAVNRLGNCSLMLMTNAADSHVGGRVFEYDQRSHTFKGRVFEPRTVWLQEKEGLQRTKLLASIRITGIRQKMSLRVALPGR